jgi:hypothetical protein
MRDIPTKVTGNNLTADEFNDIPTELENAITSAGITLSAGDLTQLSKAIAHYVGNSSFYTDTGVADAYVATPIGANKSPPAYVNGMVVEFKIGNTSTGASTINVDGLGVKNITGTASAGALTVGNFIKLRFNTGSGEFDILVNGAFDVSKFLRNDQNGVLAGDLDVTGNFSSLGIDDIATSKRLRVSDGLIGVGAAGSDYAIAHTAGDRAVTYSGGTSGGAGANLRLFGENHASRANDLELKRAGSVTLGYDDSASLFDFQSNDIKTLGKAEVSKIVTPNPLATGDINIVAGVVTVVRSFQRIDTEGDIASDDLDTINGFEDGMHLFLRASNGARTVVLKDSTGNLGLAGDFSLTSAQDIIHLIYDDAASLWLEVSRSNNLA